MSTTTEQLCAFLAGLKYDDLPAPVVHAARRGVLDWIGCALAGSTHPALEPLLLVLNEVSGKPVATVLGRNLKLGPLDAATANGYMGHVLDYDDTHLGGTILHASSPVLSALLPLCEQRTVTGKQLLLAFVCGFEAGVRSGQASPGHHKGGWHLTGTLGTLAAGIAAAKMLDVNARQMTHAMGIAATQAAGLQQNRGTMCKYLHAGKAAANGLMAGLLAQRNFDSALDVMEGPRGFCRIYSDTAAPAALVADLGTRWEILHNGYKAYACAAVLHPVIDAMIALRPRLPFDTSAVRRIELFVNPNVMTISGVENPLSGMQAKFSVYHTAAAALLHGAGGIAEYTDACATDARVIGLRTKVVITIDDSLRKDQARVGVDIDGTVQHASVEHAKGTADNPMNDAEVRAKFMSNSAPVIGTERARQLDALIWRIDALDDVREFIALCA